MSDQNVLELEGNKCAPWSAEFTVGLFVLRKKGGVKNMSMSWKHQAEERCGSVNVKLKQTYDTKYSNLISWDPIARAS